MPVLKAWAPYILVARLLVLARLEMLLRAWLSTWELGSDDILDTGIVNSIKPLCIPGTFFVVVALVAGWLQGAATLCALLALAAWRP